MAKRLTSRFKEIRDAIATALMPAFRDILTGLENNEQKFIEFKAKILENSGLISAWALVFVESVKLIGTYITGVATNFQNMGEMFVNMMEMAEAAGRLDWDKAGKEWDKFIENREQMEQADENVKQASERLGDAIRLAFSGGLIVVQDFAKEVDKLPPVLDDVNNGVAKMAVGLEANMRTVGESISKNLVGRMTDAAQGSKDAFSGFFAYMKKQLVELAMKALLFRAIMGIGTKFGIDTGGFATAMTGFSPATGGGDTGAGAPGAGTPILSGKAANASRGGLIVNQNINFSVSAIDGQSAAAFIKQQGGNIAEVIATAAKDSTAYRRQLQGA